MTSYNQKPFPGFEPGTFSLPWKRSTFWAKTAKFKFEINKKASEINQRLFYYVRVATSYPRSERSHYYFRRTKA